MDGDHRQTSVAGLFNQRSWSLRRSRSSGRRLSQEARSAPHRKTTIDHLERVYMSDSDQVKRALRALLAHRKPERVEDADGYTHASVLLPLFIKDGRYWILFMRRTHTVEYHKGEVSFPGGSVDAGDTSLEQTALRETFEEVGIRGEDIEILGQLDDMLTATSRFIVHPFVGIVPFPYAFTLNKREVDYLIEVPLRFFLEDARPQFVTMSYDGESFETPAFIYKNTIIWGATQRILDNFLGLIKPTIRLA
jgi:8-oxo-dGTP pyrophosphatase MutT (NUDIX family)